MNITIVAVGKLKESYWQSAIQEYSKRMKAYANLRIVEIADEPCPDGASPAVESAVLAKEADKILSRLGERDYVIALAVEGSMVDSVGFARQIDQLAVEGRHSFAFVIGGSLGLDDSVKQRADLLLSFSKMTFPHQMMRVVLIEQIYRAMKIRRREPYHK